MEDAEATGGVIDGGTWEHRKRAKEMLKTAETALNVTLKAKGAHHMGQYLPKEVSIADGRCNTSWAANWRRCPSILVSRVQGVSAGFGAYVCGCGCVC